jgi:hypothetical protein
MRFLFKVAFWLTIVVLLMPADSERRADDARAQVGPVEAFGVAQAAVEDAREFCARRPEACEVGSQAFQTFGEKAQHAAKLLYEFLSKQFAEAPRTATVPLRNTTGSIPVRAQPGRNTLKPADLEPAWIGPGPRNPVPLPPRRPA